MENKYVDINIPEYKRIRTEKKNFVKKEIEQFVKTFKQNNQLRFNHLYDAYKNKSMVDDKRTDDTYVPNHKVKMANAKYITNMATSYFAGVPATWKCEDEEIDDILQAVLTSNDDGGHQYKMAKLASICGTAVEMYWRDELHFRYSNIDPRTAFVVYDDAVECNPILGIRIIAISKDDEMEKEVVEVSDDTYMWKYISVNGDFTEIANDKGEAEMSEHFIGCVPIVEAANNLDNMSDFETELSIIETLNVVNSNTANDIEAFTDAFLVLRGYEATDREEMAQIKKDRTLLLDENGGAEFLTKNSDDTMQENFKKRLENAIHKLSQVPNLTDESFSNNLSGVAIRFKLIGLDALAGEKEQMYRELVRKRLEAIKHHLEIRGLIKDVKLNSSDYVKISFHRNLPQNLLEQSQVINNLQLLLSEQTQLELLPFVEDVQAELDKKKEEAKEENIPDGPFNNEVGAGDGEKANR
jgi:phage portal protein, SPP1 family